MERFVGVLDLPYGRMLTRSVTESIYNNMRHGSYKGFRFLYSLPVRGQRTHTNARTAKRILKKHSSFFRNTQR
jgi:ribosomal protein S13